MSVEPIDTDDWERVRHQQERRPVLDTFGQRNDMHTVLDMFEQPEVTQTGII